MSTNKQLFTNFQGCAGKDTDDCEELSFQTSEEFAAITQRLQNNNVTRNRGTERTSGDEPLGRYYVNQKALTGILGEENTATATPGANVKFNFAGGTTEAPSNEEGESVSEIDEGGTNREGSNNDGAVQSQLDRQRAEQQRITIDGGNKAYPYITPLASTNIAGLKLAPPHDDIDNGENGSIYDVGLLEDEGIIYLRQYLSFDDEETGAVWRFQYAPQIAWTAAATFQEDKSWGTNVQPSHFNNKSGKKITIQGAILEGMTIGKTVTGAVLALESLMSVTNPDNELQVAPYAYRLIIGDRTVTEPIENRHAPFVIESMTVKEEMYDTKGEMISVKLDLTLKEIPYYQINDGRKLLLVTEDRADAIEIECERISNDIQDIENAVLQRDADNKSVVQTFLNSIRGDTTVSRTDAQVNEEAVKLTKGKAQYLNSIDRNCEADSGDYVNLAALYRQYTEKKCTTSRPIDGLGVIERNFAVDSGIYEILLGKKLTANKRSFGRTNVFNTDGTRTITYNDRLLRLGVTDKNRDFEFLNQVFPITQEVGAQDPVLLGLGAGTVGVTGVSAPADPLANVKAGERLLKNCRHIHCVSTKVGANTLESNLLRPLQIIEWLTQDKSNYHNFLVATGSKKIDDIKSNQTLQNTIFDVVRTAWGYETSADRLQDAFPGGLVAPFILPCSDSKVINDGFLRGGQISQGSNANDGKFFGLSENDGIFRDVENRLFDFFKEEDLKFMESTAGRIATLQHFRDAGFVFPGTGLQWRSTSVDFQICTCAEYIAYVIIQKVKILRKPNEKQHGQCNSEAIAAQDVDFYENVVIPRLDAALRQYVSQLEIFEKSFNLFLTQMSPDVIDEVGAGKVCNARGVTRGELGGANCLGSYCMARTIYNIVKHFENEARDINIVNPFVQNGELGVDLHGANGK